MHLHLIRISTGKESTTGAALTKTQSMILKILKDTGGAEPETIIEQLQITPSDLEREFAMLRSWKNQPL